MIHAAVLHGIGRTPRYEPFPAPVAGDGEAVVTVTAAALSRPTAGWPTACIRPDQIPQVVGLDGVGRLADGTRVAFFAPQRPYGGMADQALVRRGMWLRVRDGVDDVTAAAVTNPGMAAWKTLMWEGELAAGQTVLVLGATGTSGRIATQLARRHGARVIAAGRDPGMVAMDEPASPTRMDCFIAPRATSPSRASTSRGRGWLSRLRSRRPRLILRTLATNLLTEEPQSPNGVAERRHDRPSHAKASNAPDELPACKQQPAGIVEDLHPFLTAAAEPASSSSGQSSANRAQRPAVLPTRRAASQAPRKQSIATMTATLPRLTP
jgi:hypothetical protein